MKTKLFITALVLSVAVVLAGSAQASITSNFIANNTGPFPATQHLNDFSWEQLLIDNNNNGIVDVGDSIWGVANFESIGLNGGTQAEPNPTRLATGQGNQLTELTAIFATEVSSATVNSSNPALTDFVMTPDAAFASSYGLSAGTFIAIYEDVAQDFSAMAPLSGPGNIFDVASNGTQVLELGFTGAAGEGWSATAPNDPNQLPPTPGPAAGTYFASLNAITQAGGYENFVISSSQASGFGAGLTTQFSINGQIFASTGTTLPIGDSADIFFTVEAVVPEPTSVVVWGGLLSAIGLATSRRRRNPV